MKERQKKKKKRWSEDNFVLSVGWSKRGCCVWSINGCRIFCTIPQLEGAKEKNVVSPSREMENGNRLQSNHPENISEKETQNFNEEPLKGGVIESCWGVGGYSLIVVASGGKKMNSKFLEFSFFKNSSTSPNLVSFCLSTENF